MIALASKNFYSLAQDKESPILCVGRYECESHMSRLKTRGQLPRRWRDKFVLTVHCYSPSKTLHYLIFFPSSLTQNLARGFSISCLLSLSVALSSGFTMFTGEVWV